MLYEYPVRNSQATIQRDKSIGDTARGQVICASLDEEQALLAEVALGLLVVGPLDALPGLVSDDRNGFARNSCLHEASSFFQRCSICFRLHTGAHYPAG